MTNLSLVRFRFKVSAGFVKCKERACGSVQERVSLTVHVYTVDDVGHYIQMRL